MKVTVYMVESVFVQTSAHASMGGLDLDVNDVSSHAFDH